MKTIEQLIQEISDANPELYAQDGVTLLEGEARDERLLQLAIIAQEELKIQARQDAILAAREQLSPELKSEVEAWDASNPAVWVNGQRLTLEDREAKLQEWARLSLLKKTDLLSFRLQEVKEYASTRIQMAMPFWKQINRIGFIVEMLDKSVFDGAEPTAQELALKAQIRAAWSWALAVRAFSDTLEARILNGEQFDVAAEAWPPIPS